MVGHGGSSAGSYLADPTSPIPSHCASIVATSTLRVNHIQFTTPEGSPEKNSTNGGFVCSDILYAILLPPQAMLARWVTLEL